MKIQAGVIITLLCVLSVFVGCSRVRRKLLIDYNAVRKSWDKKPAFIRFVKVMCK